MKKWVASLAIFAVALALFLLATDWFAQAADVEKTKIQEEAIHKACITCYAVEGIYPPTVEYLEEHYGVQIDREKYAVYYEAFASNIMPEITIVEKNGD